MSKTVKIERFTIHSPKCIHPSVGFKILHFSDLHFRGPSSRKGLRSLMDLLASIPADILVFTGDTVNRQRYWPEALNVLQNLNHPGLKIAVPGNWDYTRHGGLMEFTKVWEPCGFNVMRNRTELFSVNGSEIAISGLEDPREGRPDFRQARAVESGVFHLLACHSPDILLNENYIQPDLLLCGHTHGGQIRLPGWGAVVTSTQVGRKYDKGLFEPCDSQYVFVQSGIGTGEIPIRIGCPPCISLLEISPRPLK